MVLDRFTLFGLAVALLGWIILVGDVAVSPFTLLHSATLMPVAVLRSDIVAVAQTTIASGFALAIMGVLRAGFGALNGFFDSVLERASAPKASATPKAPIPVVEEPEPAAPPTVPVVEHTVPRPPDRSQRPRSNYVILPNGAVEVDTLLGTRVFASMDEARGYIR